MPKYPLFIKKYICDQVTKLTMVKTLFFL